MTLTKFKATILWDTRLPGFIKGQVMGKLTGWEQNFAQCFVNNLY